VDLGWVRYGRGGKSKKAKKLGESGEKVPKVKRLSIEKKLGDEGIIRVEQQDGKKNNPKVFCKKEGEKEDKTWGGCRLEAFQRQSPYRCQKPVRAPREKQHGSEPRSGKSK